MSPRTLYRLGAAAFIVSGLLNIFGGLLPTELIIQQRMLNLFGATGGMLGLTAVYLYQRVESGVLGGVSYILAAIGLIGIIGFLFTDAFVFSYISADLQATLSNGPTGIAIFSSVLLYVLGVVTFGAATIKANVYPRIAAMLYIVGTLPSIVAVLLPPLVISLIESVASVGVIWLGVALWRGVGRVEMPAITTTISANDARKGSTLG